MSPVVRSNGTSLFESELFSVLALNIVSLFALKAAKVGQAYLRHYSMAEVVLATGIVILGFAVGITILVMARSSTKNLVYASAGIVTVAILVEITGLLATGALKLIIVRLSLLVLPDAAVTFGLAAVTVVLAKLVGDGSSRAFLYLASWTFMTVAAIDTVYFVHSGSIGSLQLVLFAVSNADLVSPATAAQLGAADLIVMLAPTIFLGATAAFYAWTRPDGVRCNLGGWNKAIGLSIAAVALSSFTLVPKGALLPESYKWHSGNDMLRIISDSRLGYDLPENLKSYDFELPHYPAGVSLARPDSSRALNVILVAMESVRSRSAPPMNADGFVMPFLDSLTAAATIRRDVYANIPFTSEALVAMFAGIQPPSSGYAYYRDLDATGLPKLLAREAGYRTAFFTSAKLMEARGEAELLTDLGFAHIVDATAIAGRSRSVGYEGVFDEAVIPPLIDWAKGSARNRRPFFLAFLTYSSHHPYTYPSRFEAIRHSEKSELNQYLNSLAYLDGVLSDLWEQLEANGLLDDTAVIFIGDHGEGFGEHGAFFHGTSLYEEIVRVPLLIMTPSAPRPGSNSGGVFLQSDLFPTIVDLVGFSLTGATNPGPSIISDRGRDRVRLAAMGAQSLALLDGGTKFIYYYRRRPMQVYDLDEDPFEMNDLAGSYSRSILSAIEFELLSWNRHVNQSFRHR